MMGPSLYESARNLAVSGEIQVPAKRERPDLLAPVRSKLDLTQVDSAFSASSEAEGKEARNMVVREMAPVSIRRRMKAWPLGCIQGQGIRRSSGMEAAERVPS